MPEGNPENFFSTVLTVMVIVENLSSGESYVQTRLKLVLFDGKASIGSLCREEIGKRNMTKKQKYFNFFGMRQKRCLIFCVYSHGQSFFSFHLVGVCGSALLIQST